MIYRLAEVNLLLSPTLVRCILISGSEGLSRGLKDTHPEITKLLSIYSLTRIFNGLIEINLRDPALESCPPLPVPLIWRSAPKITDLGGVSASQIETGIKVIAAGIPIKRGDKTPLRATCEYKLFVHARYNYASTFYRAYDSGIF